MEGKTGGRKVENHGIITGRGLCDYGLTSSPQTTVKGR